MYTYCTFTYKYIRIHVYYLCTYVHIYIYIVQILITQLSFHVKSICTMFQQQTDKHADTFLLDTPENIDISSIVYVTIFYIKFSNHSNKLK